MNTNFKKNPNTKKHFLLSKQDKKISYTCLHSNNKIPVHVINWAYNPKNSSVVTCNMKDKQMTQISLSLNKSHLRKITKKWHKTEI